MEGLMITYPDIQLQEKSQTALGRRGHSAKQEMMTNWLENIPGLRKTFKVKNK